MIPNREAHKANIHLFEAKSKGRWWPYVAVKKLSALLRGITAYG